MSITAWVKCPHCKDGDVAFEVDEFRGILNVCDRSCNTSDELAGTYGPEHNADGMPCVCGGTYGDVDAHHLACPYRDGSLPWCVWTDAQLVAHFADSIAENYHEHADEYRRNCEAQHWEDLADLRADR